MSTGNTAALLPPLATRLGVNDDVELWDSVLDAVASDALISFGDERTELYAIVGSCSHWARPHQSRWTAAGGFALPEGYGDGEGFLGGLPNLDWRVTLRLDRGQSCWILPNQPPTKRFRSVRLAIPSRTRRHRQAAVHAVWSPGTLDMKQKRTVFYGFRKKEHGWMLVARDEHGEGYRSNR